MNVVVAIDFSEITSLVIDTLPSILEVSSPDDLHVYLIHIAAPEPEFVGWEIDTEVMRDQVADEFRRSHKHLQQLAEGLQSRVSGQVTPLLIQGPIAQTVCTEANRLDARMIVIGSHGHGSAYDLVIGSTSSAIIRNSQKPVLVVPTALSSDQQTDEQEGS